MNRFVLIYILCICFFSCKDDFSNKVLPTTDLIPNQFETLIKINALNDFLVNVESNEIALSIFDSIINNVTVLKKLNTQHPVYLVYPKANSKDYLIVTKNDSTLMIKDSITNDVNLFYSKTIGGNFLASTNENTLQSVKSDAKMSNLKKLIQSTDDNSVVSLLFNNQSKNYSNVFLNTIETKDSLGHIVIDFSFGNNSLNYNGFLKTLDSTSYYIQPFRNSVPQQLYSKAVAPTSTQSLVSICYADYSDFKNQINSINKKETDSISFFNYTNEVSFLEFENQQMIAFHTLNPELITEQLVDNNSKSEIFRNTPIYHFENDSIFKTKFQPYFKLNSVNFFSTYKDFVLFSDTSEAIKTIIINASNNNTLSNSEAFNAVTAQLSDESSLFIFKNESGLAEIFKTSATYNANAVQFINDNNITYINGIISNYKKRKSNRSISELFNINIESETLIAPQLVKNHINSSYDIAVQDVNNVLYLISNTGQILWKKQLQGKILGEIKQIDTYKNRRLQLAFATKNRLYIIGRNGKNVGEFPKKFNDNITQSLAVFDYDNTKNYRLLITQGSNLLMYDAKGKKIDGFEYKADVKISSQPKHFRINSKDYIVFSAGDKLKILNRRGAIRINVKDKIRFSDNSIYNHYSKFTSTNTLGQLIQVNTKGQLSSKNLKLGNKHSINATSKTLVSLIDNKLNIRSKTIDLEFGNYTSPKIFYLNDKIYVTVTDLQAKKVYLFDSQAKLIKNFPVFGTSSAILQNIDNDKSLELVTMSDNNTIIVYKLN